MKNLLNNKKILLILLAIMIAIIIIAIIVYNRNPSSEIADKYVADGPVNEQFEYIDKWKGKIRNIDDLGDFYIIKNIVNKLLGML